MLGMIRNAFSCKVVAGSWLEGLGSRHSRNDALEFVVMQWIVASLPSSSYEKIEKESLGVVDLL